MWHAYAVLKMSNWYVLVMCIMKTFLTHITAPHIHDMNIYHDMTSHTLLTCKSHANHNEEARYNT